MSKTFKLRCSVVTKYDWNCNGFTIPAGSKGRVIDLNSTHASVQFKGYEKPIVYWCGELQLASRKTKAQVIS